MADYGDPFLDWYYGQPQPAPSGMDPLAVAIPEYSQGLPPPPPPPPPPVQRIGPNFFPSETAGPTPAAQPEAPAIGPDAPPRPAPAEIEMEPDPLTVDAALRDIADPPPPPAPDPWQGDMSLSITDPAAAQAAIDDIGNRLTDPEARGQALAQDPLAYAMAQEEYDRGQGEFVRDRLGEINARDDAEQWFAQRRRTQAIQRARAETQKLDEEWKALANTKISDKRSGFQKVMHTIAAGIAGLVAGHTGGPNVGLQIVEAAINRNIEQQKAELYAKQQSLQNRKGLIGDDLDIALADFRQTEAVRAATYEKAIRQLQTEMAQYDPKGATALRHAQMIAGLRQKQQEGVIAFEKQALDMATKREELLGKRLDNAKKAGVLGGGMGGGAAKPEDKPMTPDEIRARYPGSPVPPASAGPMTPKQYGDWLKIQGQGQDVAAGGPVGAEQRRAEIEREIILPDGTKFIAKGDMGGVESLRKKVTATTDIVRLMDEALRIRTGWTSDTAKSKEWQTLKANWASAIGQAKDVLGLGALSGPDMELVEKFIGTDDPTQMRDPEAGIMKARDNILRMTAGDIFSRGGPKNWTIKPLDLKDAKATVSDEALKDLLVDNNEAGGALTGLDHRRIQREYGVDPTGKNSGVYQAEVQQAIEKSGGMYPTQKNALDAIIADSKGGDAKAKKAATEKLYRIARDAKTPAIRDAANAALYDIAVGTITGGGR